MTGPLLAAIEAGGTKFVCAVGYGADSILAETTLPTGTPAETLPTVFEFLARAAGVGGRPAALGIASFGPIDLAPESATHGRILASPKLAWSGCDLAGTFRERCGVPVAIDTDVNAAARAEALHSTPRVRSLAYVTVGTGIGGGISIDGRTLRGLLHPEMGHLPVRRGAGDDEFRGVCPFHGDCVEGLASGPAIVRRWGAPLAQLPDDHPAWRLLGGYLGQLATAIALLTSVERIVFGGGVPSDGRLLPHVRRATGTLLAGYLRPETLGDLGGYLVPPALGARSGLTGAFLLAADALQARA